MGDFVFAVAAEKGPSLQIDNDAADPRFQGRFAVGGANPPEYRDGLQVHLDRRRQADRGRQQPACVRTRQLRQPGVPQGKLTGPIEVPSKIYPGVKANVWFYVPAQWDGVTPLAVQVWGDGQQFTGPRPGQWRILETLDNLTAQKRIPLMVSIFMQAGTGPDRNERSIEYDTVSDAYLHRLLDEIFPVVAKSVKMRTDGYSRAIQGLSSGGIMAFNAAFDQPEEFSRVLSWIGSYTALRRSEAHPEGGGEYPTMVRREAQAQYPRVASGWLRRIWTTRRAIGRWPTSAWRTR